jgi:DNA-binding transcriptional MerR regulator
MADAGYLTIGKVVKRLKPQYPDLSISKVRYLEDEGLLNPSRTPSGYRLYSQRDVHRLETILYLQKNRFLPLSVIKEQLDAAGGEIGRFEEPAALGYGLPEEEDEVTSRLHPIDRMPEVAGCSVSFVRQLSEAGVIQLKKSPHGRDLVDGKDISLIRVCDELQHFGFGPKNLRQYVTAANRESTTFEQALMVYARRAGGVEMELTDESRQQFGKALTQMLLLTGQVREALIRKRIGNAFSEME